MKFLTLLLSLFLAAPVYAQQLNPGGGIEILGGPTNAVFPPGPVYIFGNSGNGTDQVTNVNVNNVLNADTFPGVDIGDKVNHAVAALPTYTVGSTQFTGSIAGTVLTVSSIGAYNGGVDVGLVITSGAAPGTTIVSRGTGTGGTGTYNVNISQTVAAGTTFNTQYNYPYGTVWIGPPGGGQTVRQFTTTIGGLNNPVMSFVYLKCDPGVQLQYHGTGPDWVNMMDRFAEDGWAGGVYDCTFLAPATAVANQNMLHFGNQHNFHVINDVFALGNAVGDKAVLAENTVYFTEGATLKNVDFEGNTDAFVIQENCAPGTPNCAINSGNSFLHGNFNFYCSNSYQPVGPESCLRAIYLQGSAPGGIGASFQFENFDFNFNLNGPDPNTAVIRLSTNAYFYQNVGQFVGENDTTGGGGLMFNSNGYSELNALHAACAGCKDSFPYFTASAMDAVMSAGPSALGGFPPGAYINQIPTLTQLISPVELICVMNSIAPCTTPPTITIYRGSTQAATLLCPDGVANSGALSTITSTFTQELYPDAPIFMITGAAGAGCSGPQYTATFHYRVY